MSDGEPGWERMLAEERAENERLRTVLKTVLVRITGTRAAEWESLSDLPNYKHPNAAATYPGALASYIKGALE